MINHSHQTLDSILYKNSLFALCENIDSTPYAVVGGMAVQLLAHHYDNSIPKRPTNDFDISVPTISFKEFSNSYGSQIARRLKNKFGYGFHLRNNHHANTVHVFDKSNPEENYNLLHFNRYQNELYRKIEPDVLKDLRENALHLDISELTMSPQEVSVLKPSRIKSFKQERFLKKDELMRLEKSKEPYITKVYEDVKSGRALTGVDLDKFYSEMISGIGIPNSSYGFAKDIYDLAILDLIEDKS